MAATSPAKTMKGVSQPDACETEAVNEPELMHNFGRFPGEGRDPSFHRLEFFTRSTDLPILTGSCCGGMGPGLRRGSDL